PTPPGALPDARGETPPGNVPMQTGRGRSSASEAIGGGRGTLVPQSGRARTAGGGAASRERAARGASLSQSEPAASHSREAGWAAVSQGAARAERPFTPSGVLATSAGQTAGDQQEGAGRRHSGGIRSAVFRIAR